MTTIAVCRKEGAMSADTRVVAGGSYYHASKVRQVSPSVLLGTAGDAFGCLVFIRWFSSPRNPITLRKMLGDMDPYDILCIELNPSSIVLWNGYGVGEHLLDQQYAVGSGGMVALEALRSGASTEEAVRRATGHDEATGGEIETRFLMPSELVKKPRRPRGR